MDNKTLIKIVRAVASHASKDTYRLHLSRIAVTSDRRIEATDDHRAIRVDTDPPHGLPVGFYDPKQLLALLRANVAPTPIAPVDHMWPSFDRVIPAREENATIRSVNVNPAYLADSASALADIHGGKLPAIRVQAGEDALAPVRLDMAGPDASAVAVIMPVRA